jgi:hypothetical protein
MLPESFTALIVLVILTSSTNAQAAIAPNPSAFDLKEAPMNGEAPIAQPCSSVNITQNLDTFTRVTADKTGAFLLSPVNFKS